MLHDEVFEVISTMMAKPEIAKNQTLFSQTLRAFLSKGAPVGFYFDDTVRQNADLLETAQDFAKAGLLAMPYESCFFNTEAFLADGDDLSCWAIYDKPHNSMFTIAYFLNDKKQHVISESVGIYDFESGIPIWQSLGDEKTLRQEQTAKMSVSACLIMLLLINHPVYRKEEVTISEKLQKSRVKKGKPRLSKYVKIGMKPHIREALRDGTGRTVAPHWRRGHLRTLASGHVVPVQAHLVNWDGDPEAPPSKKAYKA